MVASFLLAVQCERKPLPIASSLAKNCQSCKNKTIGLDYHTSSEDSDDDKVCGDHCTKDLSSTDDAPASKIRKIFSEKCDNRVSHNSFDSSRSSYPSSSEGSRKSSSQFDKDVASSVNDSKAYSSLTDSKSSLNENCFKMNERSPCPQKQANAYLPDQKLVNSVTENRTVDTNSRTSSVRFDGNYETADSNEEIDVESTSSKENQNDASHHNSMPESRKNLSQHSGSPLLSGSKVFRLEAPSISTTDVGYLYEISTRLLFATVDWVRGLTCFKNLHNIDKYHLLLDKWYSLFVLGIAQYSSMFPVSTMLFLANSSHDSENGRSNGPPLRWNTFVKLKEVVMNGSLNMKLSKEIYDYMKIITLFDQGTTLIILLLVSFF